MMRRLAASTAIVLIPAAILVCREGQAGDAAPSFVVVPKRSLHDELVSIELLHLRPRQKVQVRATMGRYRSLSELEADAQGKVDVGGTTLDPNKPASAPPLRVLWSMKVDNSIPVDKAAVPTTPDADRVDLAAFTDGREIAVGHFERTCLAPHVERTAIRDGALRGVLFRPRGQGPFPGVVTVSGSGGGINEPVSALLASHGFAVLALAYFNYDDLPKNLVEIPLEYFEEGLAWMGRQQFVRKDRLAVYGASRGGELALLLGATFPKVTVVVAHVPSHVVWGSYSSKASDEDKPAWIYRGKPLPSMPNLDPAIEARLRAKNPEVYTPVFRHQLNDVEAVRAAAISVEKIRGPVMLVSGKDDQLWPSDDMAAAAARRLREHRHPFPVVHLSYAHAGHSFSRPFMPAGSSRSAHAVTKVVLERGGTPEGNAVASYDSWPRVRRFLAEHLR